MHSQVKSNLDILQETAGEGVSSLARLCMLKPWPKSPGLSKGPCASGTACVHQRDLARQAWHVFHDSIIPVATGGAMHDKAAKQSSNLPQDVLYYFESVGHKNPLIDNLPSQR